MATAPKLFEAALLSERMAARAMALLLVLTALWSAGCADRGSEAEGEGALPATALSHAVEFSAADLAAAGGGVVLRVTSPSATALHLRILAELPGNEEDSSICVGALLNDRINAVLVGDDGVVVRTTDASSKPVLQQRVAGDFGIDLADRIDIDAGEAIPVAIGLRDASAWTARELPLEIRIEAEALVSWEVVAHRAVQCAVGLHEYSGGRLTQTPAATIAEERVAPLAFVETGVGMIFASADLGYDVSLTSGSRELARLRSQDGGDRSSVMLSNVTGQDAEVNVHRAEGSTASVAHLFFDVPSWVAARVNVEGGARERLAGHQLL